MEYGGDGTFPECGAAVLASSHCIPIFCYLVSLGILGRSGAAALLEKMGNCKSPQRLRFLFADEGLLGLLTRGVSIVSIVPLPIVGALVVSSSLHFCGYVLEALELGRMAFTCCSVPHRSQSGRAHSFRGAAVEQSAYIARIFPISSAERKSGVR